MSLERIASGGGADGLRRIRAGTSKGPGLPAFAGNCDGDGAIDQWEEKNGTNFVVNDVACVDRLGDTACDDPVNDADDDGCTAAEEAALGPNFSDGAWYDVYDVPVPGKADILGANGKRDKLVDIGDVLAVLFYTFADDEGPPNANGVDYDNIKGVHLDGDTDNDIPPPLHPIEEGQKYDRSPGLPPDGGVDPAGAPNGIIDIGDVLGALAQAFAVDCTAP